MNVAMSYWTRGGKSRLSHYDINMHQLSLHYALKHYGKVHLYTDEEGAERLKELPFTSVSTELKDLPKVNTYWSLGKIYAYKLLADKKQPFLHLDSDVFLFEPLPEQLLNSRVFAQHLEGQPGVGVNEKYLLKHFYEVFTYAPFVYTEPSFAPNMGIFGGTDTDFIGRYAMTALKFCLDQSKALIQDFLWKRVGELTNQPTDWVRAAISEQYILWAQAQQDNVPIEYLMTDEERIRETERTDGEPPVYTHLTTHKSNPGVMDSLIRRLINLNLPVAAGTEEKIKSPEQPLIRKDFMYYTQGAIKALKGAMREETEQSKARLAICGGCDQWTGKSCKQCGCFTALKVKIPEEKCPLGKW